jgi:hypothetical protein
MRTIYPRTALRRRCAARPGRALRHLVGLAILLVSTVAAADVTGTYEVKYDEVSSNCASPLRYPHGKLDVKQKGTTVTIDIDRTPILHGSVSKTGKISAKSKSGPTSLGGMNGVFSVAGKITPEGMLALVMVAEYTANGKPLCSQSWNVSGSKADAPAPTKGKRQASSVLELPSFALVE